MMSIQEAQVLEALTWLLRCLHERVIALEERYPTYASGYLPHADTRGDSRRSIGRPQQSRQSTRRRT